MAHDEYWKNVWKGAHERLEHLFSNCDTGVADIVGDDNGIDSVHDAKEVLAHALRCADDCREKACAIISACECVHALHELHEHGE